MTHDQSDPVLTLVAGLRPQRPTMTFDGRVKHRCHQVMERKVVRRGARPRLRRAVDLALIGIVGSYAAIVLIQATQIAARVLGLH